MKTKIKIAVIAMLGFAYAVTAQIDSNNNLQIGYQKKIYSVSSEPFKFEMIPFGVGGNTEFRNYYATGKYQFYVSNGIHGNGNILGLLINHDGNVGIGTNNPDKQLTVNNQIKILKSGNNRTQGDKAELIFGEKDSDLYSGSIRFENTNSNPGYLNPKMVFALQDYNSHTLDKVVDRMTILSNGNVGIGTTNPGAKLDVRGDFAITGSEQNNDKNFSELKFINYYTTSSPMASISVKTNANGSAPYNYSNLIFNTSDGFNTLSEKMRITSNGNVGIGTTDTKGFKLGVNGKVAATEVKIATYTNWSDFVFYEDYQLPTLFEVENHIKEKGHLKDIPSAKVVEKNGFYLGEMDAKLLQKIEELTLYTIQQEKKINNQNKEIELLKSQQERIDKLEKENKVLKMLLERVNKLEKLLQNN